MKFTVKFACSLIIILISTGCVSTQLVPVPQLDRDPNSAIVILKRPSVHPFDLIRVEVYDNTMLIGILRGNDELKWSRGEGTLKLEIKYSDLRGSPNSVMAANTILEVKKNNVYVLYYTVTGNRGVINGATLKLENNEPIKAIFTSTPSGALIYSGPSQDSLKSLDCKTPCTKT